MRGLTGPSQPHGGSCPSAPVTEDTSTFLRKHSPTLRASREQAGARPAPGRRPRGSPAPGARGPLALPAARVPLTLVQQEEPVRGPEETRGREAVSRRSQSPPRGPAWKGRQEKDPRVPSLQDWLSPAASHPRLCPPPAAAARPSSARSSCFPGRQRLRLRGLLHRLTPAPPQPAAAPSATQNPPEVTQPARGSPSQRLRRPPGLRAAGERLAPQPPAKGNLQ